VTLRVATWNVNSLNVRLPRLLDWLAANVPDIVGLQETKLEDGKFPVAELAAAGYALQFCGQRTYNGVALLSRTTGTEVVAALPDHDDVQKRLLAATVDGVRVVCLYVPNGQAVGSEKYRYKLDWLAAATRFLRREFEQHPQLAVIGDFNVAPDDRDVHDPDLWRDQIDAFRLFDQPPKTFSWWDYRQLAFPKNHGLRIDHVLLSPALARVCTGCRIDRQARKGAKPSDHAPVIADLSFT
jgi:exodeoxyribonuclease III